MDSATRQRRENFDWMLSWVPWIGMAFLFLEAAHGFGWF
jgi:hypothetical protein